MSRPDEVWEKTWYFLADDVLYNARNAADNPELHLTEEQLKNIALSKIEKMLSDNYSSLRNFAPMPVPDPSILLDGQNKLLLDELSYDRVALKNEHDNLHKLLNEDQCVVYDRIMSSVNGGRGGVFFVYGSGGTGKTFVWKTLCAALCSRGDIVLPVASSGIASLLMPRGRTAHSRFGIPINIDETSVCSKIKPGSDMAELLKKTKLIIWDEAPMTHKYCFEALDRSLRDIMRTDGESSNRPFGGLVVVFGGDFRQILPVVVKGSRQDIVHTAICSSNFWDSCEVLKLTKNMRLKSGSSDAEAIETKDFANWILDIGDGTAGGQNDGEIDVEIPSSNLIDDVVDPIAAIINDTYPNLVENMGNYQYFQDRAILAPTNEMVENINVEVLSKLSGEEFNFMSADSICQSEGGMDGNEDMFSVEFLNTIRCSGVPNHEIRLKVGCMIMLLRNIDQSKELCNGTRLIVTKLTPYVIEAQIITGSRAGERVLIGRMILSPSDNTKYPVIFQRRQFPVAVCYGMTINKSQGQSLSNVGLYLPTDVFSHGQLYVALSRVTTKKGLRVLIDGENGYTRDRTKNVVYKEVFHNL